MFDLALTPPGPFPGQLTPASSDQGSISSPVSASSGRRSPWKVPRRPTIVTPQAPHSPELMNLDCAFPPFPITADKAASAKDDKKKWDDSTNTSRNEGRNGNKTGQHKAGSPSDSRRSSRQFGSSPDHQRRASTASSRQRSKSVATDARPSTAGGERKGAGAFAASARKGSAEKMPPLPPMTPAPSERPYPLTRAQTTTNLTPIPNNNIMQMPPPPPRRPSADPAPLLDSADAQPQTGQRSTTNRVPSYKGKRPPPILSNIPVGQDGQPDLSKLRSPTVPLPNSAKPLGRSLTKLFGRRRSQSATSRREVTPAALGDEPVMQRPTPPIQFSDFNATRQPAITSSPLRELSPQAAANNGVLTPFEAESFPSQDHLAKQNLIPPRTDSKPEPAEMPAPIITQFQFGLDVPRHTSPENVDAPFATSIARRPSDTDLRRASMDSASSYESEDFSERTSSSRSSPPPHDELARKIAESLSSDAEKQTSIHVPAPLEPKDITALLESPTDPCFVNGKLSPIPDDSPATASPVTLMEELEMPPPRPAGLKLRKDSLPGLRPRKDSLTAANRPTGAHKGICRGCEKPILPAQKSVSSADGRLTGRYHKQCFVCRTCQSSFPTAEFYVSADHPYCAYHYHKLENTLCATCGRGIEGHYMETANVAGKGREKHHPTCLKCTTCRVQLSHDYFELSGKVYCERDAFRMASRTKMHDRSPARPSPLVREYISSGDPKGMLKKGSNFPERRTTKLRTMN